MKQKLFLALALVFSTGLFAQSLNEIDLQNININGLKLYFSTTGNAQLTFGQPIKIETYRIDPSGPYDGIYPYYSIDPYGALYGFYPIGFYGGPYGYGPYGAYGYGWDDDDELVVEVMAYPNMVLYFSQESPDGPKYLNNANVYGKQYALNLPGGSVKVGDNVAKLQKMFPESFRTAQKRHKAKDGSSFPRDFKVIVKAKQGAGMTSESARIVFAVNQTGTVNAIQVRLH